MLPTTALRQTIQEFPPPTSLGASLWFSATERGWYLPAYGERQRDQKLRDYDRHEDNALWQGAEAGFLKWAANVPWEVTGQGEVVVDRGSGPERVDAVAYFTSLLQDAHFGAGWKYWVQRGGRDFLSQDFGWLVELIGPGDPSTPLQGAVSGIAVLDSLRCFATGNPVFPIIYFSQITGKLHRLHASRVARFVDMPDGDERLYGNGLCALSRYISIAQQQIYMSRYIVQNLDDKPKPGVNIWSNVAEGGVQVAIEKYLREIGSDELGPLGKTINVYNIDPTAPAKLEPITFSNPPEKFDYRTYMDIHVNALALALGVDKQELWELGSGNLGSGQQSEILAQKARGKAKGDFLTTIERFVNIRVLPDADAVGATCAVSFKFKYKDEDEERAQTDKDQALVSLAEGLKRLGFANQTIANLLADRSETFKELLTDDAGQVQVGTAADDAVQADRTAADDTPQLQEQPTTPQLPAFAGKDYTATRADFISQLTDLIHGGLADDVSRRRFGIVARAQLRHMGQLAYEDGLKENGVDDPVDDEDLAVIQGWLGDQSQYVTKFADELFQQGLTSDEINSRTTAWANKSLETMYQAGRLSADKNGMYEFTGDDGAETCETCQRLKGQRHRLRDWNQKQMIPRRDTHNFKCGGWQCQHRLVRVQGKAMGGF